MKSLQWLRLLAAVSGVAATAGATTLTITGCSDDSGSNDTPCVGAACGGMGGMGAGGGNTGGDGVGGGGQTTSVCGGDTGVECECTGACCPNDSCHDRPGVPADYGDECAAKKLQSKESGEEILSYKVAWNRSTKPAGNTAGQVYSVLSEGADLPEPMGCNLAGGLAVFNQILYLDLRGDDISTHRVYTGWMNNIPTAAEATQVIQQGGCMIEDTFDQPDYNLPESKMSPSDDYPAGLPAPMARGERGSAATSPWQVKPTVLGRVAEDFTLPGDREELLSQIAADAEIDGVTFINEETGYSHSFVPLTWVVVTLGAPIAIPFREVETKYQLNDPDERACMGAMRAGQLPANCVSITDPNEPEWGWYDDRTPGTAPATATGYFLISEIEQVYSAVQQRTLCVSYPGTQNNDPMGAPIVQGEGFFNEADRSCNTATFDPATGSLPMGDWCAATNSAATADCHDSWRSETFQVFQSFPVQDPTQTTCDLMDPPPAM